MMKFDRFMSPKESHRSFDNRSMGEYPRLVCISSVIYPDGKLFDKLDVQFIPVIFGVNPVLQIFRAPIFARSIKFLVAPDEVLEAANAVLEPCLWLA